MPWRLLIGVSAIGVIAGAMLGVVRGLDYLPTLPVAIVEGGVLVGAPAAVFGLVLVGLWSLSTDLRRTHAFRAPEGAANRAGGRLVCLASEVVGAGAVIASAAAMPWASFRRGPGAVVFLDAGSLRVAVVVVGSVGVVLAVLQVCWRAATLESAQILAASSALILSLVTAAGRIAHANSAIHHGGSTAFGVGSVVGVLAAVVLTAAAVVAFVQSSPG